MLSDPITITVNSVGKVLARQPSKGLSTIYSTQDGLFSLEHIHRNTKSGAHVVSSGFSQKVMATDPFDASRTVSQTFISSIMFTIPVFGFTNTVMEQHWAGHKAWIDNTILGKLIGGES
jgi:hypothetical protein